ncbi:MAG: methionyl-tRNA formyltransferase [Proteobacteria bacterium]|nr:methionyl-tRNA formyltransferase [Pseudomonadota bacterium]
MGLKIALFGQAPVGVGCLEGLIEAGHEIVGVYAPPDGRRPDGLAERTEELGLPLFKRRYFRRRSGEAIAEALDGYRGLGAELNLLASVTALLPVEILDAPVHRSLCFHPSLLPRYRGGNAMQWQIIEGEAESGVSVFVPDDGVDTGPLVVQRGGVEIDPEDTTGSLFFGKLAPLGVEALLEAVEAIGSGRAVPAAQDESRATHQGLVDDEVARIDLMRPGEEIDRLVRGCDPQPGAYLLRRGEKIRLYDVSYSAQATREAPGTLLDGPPGALSIALRGGLLRVGRVRADAGKENSADFVQRAGLKVGDGLSD